MSLFFIILEEWSKPVIKYSKNIITLNNIITQMNDVSTELTIKINLIHQQLHWLIQLTIIKYLFINSKA